MKYTEVPCAGILGEFVECEWCLKGAQAGSIVHPDGCADVVFDESGKIFLAGVISHSRFLKHDFGPEIRGLRLKVGAIPIFFNIPASVVANRVVSVADLPSPLARAITASARQAGHKTELVGATRKLLSAACVGKSRERRLSSVFSQLQAKSLRAIMSSVGLSPRQVHRVFLQEAGLGPSRLKRIYRLQRVIDAMRRHPQADLSLATFALDQGFFDQAHMTHDVKDLAGLTPSALLRSLAQP
jgi:AraC-like DNA-binding protein